MREREKERERERESCVFNLKAKSERDFRVFEASEIRGSNAIAGERVDRMMNKVDQARARQVQCRS